MLRGLISHNRLSLTFQIILLEPTNGSRHSTETGTGTASVLSPNSKSMSTLLVLSFFGLLRLWMIFLLCSYTVEVMEIQADNPTLQVLFIRGNPGVVTFYKDFVESLYELLGGSASVTAVGHISHTNKNWELGKLFSSQGQIMNKLSDVPDWAFMRENQHKISFLFGVDDHWGPLQMFEEIGKQVPDASLTIEREGHTHAFCCTEAGSLWVAEHVASLIKNKVSL